MRAKIDEFNEEELPCEFQGESGVGRIAGRCACVGTGGEVWCPRDGDTPMEAGFSGRGERKEMDHDQQVKELHAKIGQLTVERDFLLDARLVQTWPVWVRRRQEMINPANDNLGGEAQCRLLSISRSGWCYKPKGETPLNLKLMRLIDEQFLATPTYGSRKMAHHYRHYQDEPGVVHGYHVYSDRARVSLFGGCDGLG